MVSYREKFEHYIKTLQSSICEKIEEIDGTAKFKEDLWTRKEGGGGKTRVIVDGEVFEKGGVNISSVYGKLPESLQEKLNVTTGTFFACGLSLVLHPKNPFIPTVHANWRYFEMYDTKGNIIDQWFGGGQDLTPYYIFEEDVIHWHKVCKAACDRHNITFYSLYKKACDDYFWNSHRNEARGVGGIFYDYLRGSENITMDNWYNFTIEIGDCFLKAYIPIVEKRKKILYHPNHREWQEIRRGRYVEFNLIHDRGTLFGLRTNGRIESILMSLPPHVQWVYNYVPEDGSAEAKLIKVLQHPKEWV